MNIGTGIVILGIIFAGYWFFIKKQGGAISDAGTVAKVAEQTIVEGTNLARTIKELNDLNKAVLSSIGIFNTQAFRDLQDFSIQVPEEPVGRNNPFVPTIWKAKLNK